MASKTNVIIGPMQLKNIAKLAKWNPQTSYTGLQRSLQQEWTFIQRVVKMDKDLFKDIEIKLKEKYIPTLFGQTPPPRFKTK